MSASLCQTSVRLKCGLAILFSFAWLLPSPAHAGIITTIQNLLSSTLQTDESVAMLRQVLGPEFIQNPFAQQTAGANSTVLGTMFLRYNIFMFTAAMLWFTYNALAGLAHTMHEGVILGRRMSTVWFPIRVAFGAASLMPVFGGWALCQAVMVVACLLGIAGANQISSAAIDAIGSGTPLVNPMQTVQNTIQTRDFEVQILRGMACMAAANEQAMIHQANFDNDATEGNADGLDVPATFIIEVPLEKPNILQIRFPSTDRSPTGCGILRMVFNPMQNSTAATPLIAGSAFGFRVEGIDYEGVRNAAMRMHAHALANVAKDACAIAIGAVPLDQELDKIQIDGKAPIQALADQSCLGQIRFADGSTEEVPMNQAFMDNLATASQPPAWNPGQLAGADPAACLAVGATILLSGGVDDSSTGQTESCPTSSGAGDTLARTGFLQSYDSYLSQEIAKANAANPENPSSMDCNGFAGTGTPATPATTGSVQSISMAQTRVIKCALVNRMKEGGWITLGVWYGVFAAATDAINSMLDFTVTWDAPAENATDTSTEGSIWQGIQALVKKAKAIINTQVANAATPNAAGNISFGQYLTQGTLHALVGTSSSGGPAQMINPIIVSKTLGDNMLNLAVGMMGLTAWAQGNAEQSKAETEVARNGAISKFLDKFTNIGGIKGMLGALANQTGHMMQPIATMLFVAACFLAFYIPMLPFIQWFASAVQWFMSILESLVGSSLWALAHFDSEGEGMGQRTSYGYIFMVNNFIRPIIMVFAFMFASAAIIVLGTFLYKYYMPAVASAQGNSMTGLFSILAYTLLFIVMMISLVNTCFQLMLHMADRLISWVGGNANTPFGQGIETHINSVFMQAARGPQGMFRGAPSSGSNDRSPPGPSIGPGNENRRVPQ